MVKTLLLKVRLLGGLFNRIAKSLRQKMLAWDKRRYGFLALLSVAILVVEFLYLALIWPKEPSWSIKGLPASFQWGQFDFQQTEMGRLPAPIEAMLGISPSYSRALLTQDGKYFIALAWRQGGWPESAITAELSDFLAKTYPDRRQLVLPDKTAIEEFVFAPETVIKKDLPAFDLRLLTKNGHSMAFLVSRSVIVVSNYPAALFKLLTVDK